MTSNSCYYVKSVRIRSYSGLYFPAFGLNKDQNNSEYRHFLRSVLRSCVFIFRFLPPGGCFYSYLLILLSKERLTLQI